MELMIIIVQEQDYPKLSSTFIHNRVMATKFSTEGLYLNKKNITLMVCIEKEREEEILDYIRQSCTERMEERQVCEYNGDYGRCYQRRKGRRRHCIFPGC